MRGVIRQLDGDRGSIGEPAECRPQSGFAENRRVDAVCELAQLLEGRMRFVDGALEDERELLVAVGLGGPAGETQVVGEGEQPLLRAVVQVALEAPPSGVSCLHDPRT